MQTKRRSPNQWVAIVFAAGNAVSLAISSVLFFIGFLDWTWFSRQVPFALASFLVALVIYKLPRKPQSYNPDRALKLTRFFFVLGGAIFGSVAIFFATGFLLIALLGHPVPAGPLGDAYLTFSFAVGPIIGGVVGYLIYRKSKYSNPKFYSPFYE